MTSVVANLTRPHVSVTRLHWWLRVGWRVRTKGLAKERLAKDELVKEGRAKERLATQGLAMERFATKYFVTPIIAASLLVGALSAAGCRPADERSGHAASARPSDERPDLRRGPAIGSANERIKAVVLDAREDFGDSTFAMIRNLGATHVSLVSFGFQEEASNPVIRFSPDVRWFSESAAGARGIANRAEQFGLRIILKPQLWLRGGAWTADIDFANEQDWITWESGYREYLLHTANLATQIGAEMVIIGTELSNPVRKRPAFWRSLIAEIRTLYDGQLTYAANWHDDYEHVSFWEALDYIGVNAYFPISEAGDPSLSELRDGWRVHGETLEAMAYRENIPVLFTELGYRSVSYAAAEPWRWPSRDEVGAVEPDYRLQSDLYGAFFDVVWPAPWFAGAVIWKMYPYGPDRRGSGRRSLDFTPQDKPAEQVIRDGFSGFD